ncbi:MAG: ABC transporter permease [Planctomycetes bacterium]|nr:ABC transporter permease [Planctomycetota bacterium]
MRLPIRYSIRNLFRRKTRTALTVAAVAMVTAVAVVMFGFARGVLQTAKDSGSADNIVVMDRKAASMAFSKITLRDLNLIKSLPQIARDAADRPLISPEALHQSRLDVGEHKGRPATVRGVLPELFEVNRKVHMVAGERPSSGRKVAVGSLAHATLGVPEQALATGAVLKFQNQDWTIVGHFSAGGTALDSEILADLSDVMAVYQRDSYSAVLIKLASVSDVTPLVRALNDRNDVQVKAVEERQYYRGLAEGFERVILLAVGMAIVAAIGGLVSGMNTMYASVLSRVREIGTLKVLGFKSGDIVLSFVVESLAIAALGGALGCAAGWLANGVSAKISTSAFTITVDQQALLAGACVAALIGLIGALPPALKGARMAITEALHAN